MKDKTRFNVLNSSTPGDAKNGHIFTILLGRIWKNSQIPGGIIFSRYRSNFYLKRVKFVSRHVLRFSRYTAGTPYSLVLLSHILLFVVAGATASLENVITQSPREAAQTETEARGKTHWRIQIPGDRGELAVLVTHERRSAVVYRWLHAPPNVISSSGSPATRNRSVRDKFSWKNARGNDRHTFPAILFDFKSAHFLLLTPLHDPARIEAIPSNICHEKQKFGAWVFLKTIFYFHCELSG